MSHTIKLTFQGGRQNHIVNPLNKLDGRVYDTREEACEAIYSALYDVISGENGCEMVDRPDFAAACDGIRVLDDESHGTVAVPYWEDKIPTEREFWAECGETIDDDNEIPTISLFEYFTQVGCTTANIVFGNDAALRLRVEEAEEIGAILDNYSDLCHDYILREGYASEDGVSASVEEMPDEENA